MPEVEEMQQFSVLHDLCYVGLRHCKEKALIYMYALLCSTENAFDVTSYRRLFRPRATNILDISMPVSIL